MTQNEDANFLVVHGQEVEATSPEQGLTRKVLAYNSKLFLAEHTMAKGWAGASHSHPHEQSVYVVEGLIEVDCDGGMRVLSSGDSFVVRGGVEHSVRALEESRVLDVFTPCREDYIIR